MGGTAFRIYGHYGSTVFDPMDGSSLEIVICDECLELRMEDKEFVKEQETDTNDRKEFIEDDEEWEDVNDETL